MLIFDSLHESASGCLRVARIGSELGNVTLVYRDNRGLAHWEFGLHHGCGEASVRASTDEAQAIFNGLMHTIDPERKLPRHELPGWARHESTSRKRVPAGHA